MLQGVRIRVRFRVKARVRIRVREVRARGKKTNYESRDFGMKPPENTTRTPCLADENIEQAVVLRAGSKVPAALRDKKRRASKQS